MQRFFLSGPWEKLKSIHFSRFIETVQVFKGKKRDYEKNISLIEKNCR